MALSDDQFRFGVIGVGLALAAGLGAMRFCGSVTLPPRPASTAGPSGSSSQLLTRSTASPVVYADFLASDAAAAGVRAPSPEDIGRALVHRVDDQRHVLEVGQPAIEVAGVRLAVERADDALVLTIENPSATDLAYAVTTTPAPSIAGCNAAPALLYNAMVVGKRGRERRVECVWRPGMALVVTRVETLEVSPLSAYYLSLVPPSLVGIDPRVARGHRAGSRTEKCSTVLSQAVRSGLEQGQIAWKDLADFYARHRCMTYRFPMSYRAFSSDNERALPAVGAGM